MEWVSTKGKKEGKKKKRRERGGIQDSLAQIKLTTQIRVNIYVNMLFLLLKLKNNFKGCEFWFEV
jgi:hypothetical protein